MKRLRKVFECDTAVYLQAKRKADDEGLHFQRYVERAICDGLKGRRQRTTTQRDTHDLMFVCEKETYEQAKTEAHNEGVYLSRWLERQLKGYMEQPTDDVIERRLCELATDDM
jgi:hypothetical protein